ncbi:MAG: ribosome assembly cofactor RimP [Mucilaginibacter sp.]|uniref:ribosome assembly cofactor RimP n=1 Tax=Mucilaginibacter sp. TaxID=1882438 RepID=UPI0034E4C05A
MTIEERVKNLVEEKVSDRPDLFLVDVKMHINGNLIVLVDGDQGIGIADCAAISRFVGFHLEEDNVIEQAYNLEVSSPGVDFPLKSLRQFQKNIGRNLQLKLADGSKKEGKLLAADEEGISIEEKITAKGKKATFAEARLTYGQIAEAIVLVSFK